VKFILIFPQYKSIKFPENPLNNAANWMGGPNDPLSGFSWRSGVKRDTTGIILWDDVFLHDNRNGEKLAIVVMDTQGLFDNETTKDDNSRIFALGTLISSVQVLNLSMHVQEDQLQYLHYATEFAKFVAKNSSGEAHKPFQNLLFLIRDWQNDEEFQLGTHGGKQYIQEVLEIKPNHKEELKQVREYLPSIFEQINCCLMPHPGLSVIRNKKFTGEWQAMDETFKAELTNVIQTLLSSTSLVPKKINGKTLTGAELKNHLILYFESFRSDDLPQPKTLVEGMVEMLMNSLIDKCVESYKQVISENRDKFEEGNLEHFNDLAKTKAMLMFKDEKKMGNEAQLQKFESKLSEIIQKNFEEWKGETGHHLKQMKEEKEKSAAAIIEKKKAEKEKLEAEKVVSEMDSKLAKLDETLKSERVKHDNQVKEIQNQNSNELTKVKAAAAKTEENMKRELENKQRELVAARQHRPAPFSFSLNF
jgi:atlastin